MPRLVARGPEINAARVATVVGFGHIDLNGTLGYGLKRKVEVPITSLDCGAPGDLKKYGCFPQREMVAGHRGLKLDSCSGDSGGPLYIQANDGVYLLLGATSRAPATALQLVATAASMCAWINASTGFVPSPASMCRSDNPTRTLTVGT